MQIKWQIFNRKIHYWGSVICAIPVIIIIITGMFLIFKKQSDWIQPPTQKGYSQIPTISFEKIIDVLIAIPELNVTEWTDIKRLDVRPSKGIVKVQTKNNIEIQIDHHTGEVLQIAKRRSDLIESIHDGSFFHKKVKFFIFFPAALVLLVLWVTGIYLFLLPYLRKKKKRV